jgi:AraC-like DNA-binding protein
MYIDIPLEAFYNALEGYAAMNIRKPQGFIIWKIITPCLLIFSVSIVIINIVFDHFYIKTLRENTISSNLMNLDYLHNNFDNFYQGILNIKNSLQIDKAIRPSYPINEITPVLDLKEKLKNYLHLNPLIDDIGFYCKQDEFIYFARTSCRASAFFDRFTILNQTSPNLIFSGELRFLVPVYDQWYSQNSLLLVLPYSSKFTMDNDVITFFIIPDVKMKSMLKPAAGGPDGFAGIFNTHAGFLSFYSPDNSVTIVDTTRKLLEDYPLETAYIRKSINSRNYIVARFPSALNEFSYVVVTPEEPIIWPIIRIKNNWIMVIVLILGCGIAVMIFSTSISYRPINDMMENIITDRTRERVIERIAEIEKLEKNFLASDMASYLDSHYNDMNFTLQNMAEHFEIPVPILTKYFRDHHEMTILNYITAVRIRKSCALLTDTRLPVKEIGLKVGFVNETSFIRRFKQIPGLSPGQYRIVRRGT